MPSLLHVAGNLLVDDLMICGAQEKEVGVTITLVSQYRTETRSVWFLAHNVSLVAKHNAIAALGIRREMPCTKCACVTCAGPRYFAITSRYRHSSV